MNKQKMYVAGMTVLLLGVVFTTYGVWTQSGFSHAEPGFDQGCYCHNNGIAIYVNRTGDGMGGLFFGPINAGTFHLYITTNNVAATGIVPGLQQWESNQTDNAKFTFSPAKVTDGSTQDRSPIAGNITALYTITTPTTPGTYVLTLYAQGTLMQPIVVQVSGSSTSTSTTTSSSSTTSSTSTTHSSSTSSTSTSTTSTTTTTSSTSTTATTSTTTTPSGSLYSIGVGTNAKNYSATESLTITGSVSPAPGPGTAVEIQVTNPGYTTVVFDNNVTVAAGGAFSYTVNIVANSTGWIYGLYTVTVTSHEPAPMMVTSQFFYTPHTVTIASTSTATTVTSTTTYTRISLQTTTQTSTQTATTTATVTSPPSTVTTTQAAPTVTSTAPPTTQTQTITSTSTLTQTSSSVPQWAYGGMAVLLLAGLAIGYAVKRPSARRV